MPMFIAGLFDDNGLLEWSDRLDYYIDQAVRFSPTHRHLLLMQDRLNILLDCLTRHTEALDLEAERNLT